MLKILRESGTFHMSKSILEGTIQECMDKANELNRKRDKRFGYSESKLQWYCMSDDPKFPPCCYPEGHKDCEDLSCSVCDEFADKDEDATGFSHRCLILIAPACDPWDKDFQWEIVPEEHKDKRLYEITNTL